MPKMIWISLASLFVIISDVSAQKFKATINYDTASTKSGHRYLEIKSFFVGSKDSLWMAFGPEAIAEFVRNSNAVKNLESQINEYKTIDSLRLKNENLYKETIDHLQENEATLENLAIDMRSYNDELYHNLIKAEGQKWSWSLKGLLIGAAIGSLGTFVIIQQSK